MTHPLLAGTNRSSQTAVVNAIVIVPKRLAQLDSLAEHFDLLLRSGRGIRWQEVRIDDWIEILVVSILQNRLENVLAQIAHCLAHLSRGGRFPPPKPGKTCPEFHTVNDYFQRTSKVKEITVGSCVGFPFSNPLSVWRRLDDQGMSAFGWLDSGLNIPGTGCLRGLFFRSGLGGFSDRCMRPAGSVLGPATKSIRKLRQIFLGPCHRYCASGPPRAARASILRVVCGSSIKGGA